MQKRRYVHCILLNSLFVLEIQVTKLLRTVKSVNTINGESCYVAFVFCDVELLPTMKKVADMVQLNH